MRRHLLILLALALTAWAANQKLYMSDGTYQLVREYKLEGDRVKFYSIERSDWEEVPKELVDLTRTEKEFKERQTQLEKEAKVFGEEEKVARDLEKRSCGSRRTPGCTGSKGRRRISSRLPSRRSRPARAGRS